jgi:ADP-dependent NAD(P)H-hydrate dehydratase
MIGAPAMVARAAFRSGAGLVQVVVPREIQPAVAVLAPTATTRTLHADAKRVLQAIEEFHGDVVALGPGLGDSLSPDVVQEVLCTFGGPMVVDADGLNALAATDRFTVDDPGRVIITPHPGEMRRLLKGRGVEATFDNSPKQRRAAAVALLEAYGFTVVLKGRGTVVTDGKRLYVNETGNAGLATGGTGDVLTGVIAGLLGQKMDPLEAAILGVYVHGLAGDFAAEELGRLSMDAVDVIEYLPEAFGEHSLLELD